MVRLDSMACLAIAYVFVSCSPSSTPNEGGNAEEPTRGPASERAEEWIQTIDLIGLGDVSDHAVDDADLGVIDIRDHKYFGYGWYLPEDSNRSLGARAGSIDFSLNRVRPLRLRLKLAPPQGPQIPRQQLKLFWNGTPLGVAALAQSVQILELAVPESAQRIGPNRLELLPKFWVDEARLPSRGKHRDQSVELQGLEFVHDEFAPRAVSGAGANFDGERIIQRPGSVITYAFPASRSALLVGEGRIETPGEARGEYSQAVVQVYVSDRQGRTRSMWQERVQAGSEGQDLNFELDLSEYAGDYFAVSIVNQSINPETSPNVVWKLLALRTNPMRESVSKDLLNTGKRPNILVVLFDTLRADHTEPYGATNVRTPNMLRLSQEGTTFQNTFAPSSWTRSSVATLLTGANISYHKTYDYPDVFPKDIEYLPEILKQNGYATTAISFNGHITKRWGFGRGFDTFHELGKRRESMLKKRPTPEAFAEHIWENFLQPAITTNAPFFVYLHELDPHGPYEPPPPYDTMYSDAYRGWADIAGEDIHLIRYHLTKLEQADYEHLNAQYRGEVSFMDAYLGVILEKLDAAGELENTLIVFLSDHGEEFGEHGGIGHGVTLHNEVLKVPFIWSWRGVFPHGVSIPDTVGLIDFTPTILDILSLSTSDSMQGRSLKALLTGESSGLTTRPLYQFHGGESSRFHRGIQRDEWKLIRRTISRHDSFSLFDLSKDPKEFNNLWSREPVIGGALRQELDAALRRDAKLSTVTSTRIQIDALDPQDVEELENLGYLR